MFDDNVFDDVFDEVFDEVFDPVLGPELLDLDPRPAGLDGMEPGLVLAAFLSAIDVGELSGHDRVVVLRAHQRMASHYQAEVYAAMASVADAVTEGLDDGDDPGWAEEAAAAEIRAALRLTRRAADAELGFALELRRRLPEVWAALGAGDIDLRRARITAHGTQHLSEGTAREVVARVIDEASRLTTGQLAARIRRLCLEADPAEAQLRYQDAIAERRVVMEPTESGTAHLCGYELPPYRVAEATRRINHLARSLKTADETRSMDQLRADVYLDLLIGNAGSGEVAGGGGVEIQVDLPTLMGLAEDAGELAGYGPVVADIARRVAEEQAGSQRRYTVTDAGTGRPISTGTTRRRPAASQRRDVEARDVTCIFPGCRMPAAGCDLDHRVLWSEGGPTTVDQLVPLCRHEHVIRHRAGWRHQPLAGGDHAWISALGYTYTTSGQPP
jgi:hypothetical protein